MAQLERIQSPTGRLIGALRPERKRDFVEVAKKLVDRNFVSASSLPDCTDFCALGNEKSVLYDNIDAVLIAGQLRSLTESEYFTAVEPERASPIPLPPAIGPLIPKSGDQPLEDTRQRTWGVALTRAFPPRTAAGIRLAIVDSGIKLCHEAFVGRTFPMRSFVSTPANVDEIGHGTACAGIICGRPDSAEGRCFSVAPDVDLHVAKIFDGRRVACDARILAAIDWAVGLGCEIISMSIGGHIARGMNYSSVFNDVAGMAAEKKNVLIIAGAGNESRRNLATPSYGTVAHPANCPNIMCVGAIDGLKEIANFSNRSFDANGGEINLVAPGLSIRTAQARGTCDAYYGMDGTSAAVPFVAGIAALWAKSGPERGLALWKLLEDEACDLGFLREDQGEGLVQAPP